MFLSQFALFFVLEWFLFDLEEKTGEQKANENFGVLFIYDNIYTEMPSSAMLV